MITLPLFIGAQWLSGRVLDSRPTGRGFEPHRCHCVVSLSKNINPSLVLVQPRKTRPYITERLLMGRKESNQTSKQNLYLYHMIAKTTHHYTLSYPVSLYHTCTIIHLNYSATLILTKLTFYLSLPTVIQIMSCYASPLI